MKPEVTSESKKQRQISVVENWSEMAFDYFYIQPYFNPFHLMELLKPQEYSRLTCNFQIATLQPYLNTLSLQAGIEFKKNLRVRFGKYGGLKLGYFWVVKSKKVKSFIRG